MILTTTTLFSGNIALFSVSFIGWSASCRPRHCESLAANISNVYLHSRQSSPVVPSHCSNLLKLAQTFFFAEYFLNVAWQGVYKWRVLPPIFCFFLLFFSLTLALHHITHTTSHTHTMSSAFSSLSSSLIARQIARVSRPRPWVRPVVVKPAPVACSASVPPSLLSSLTKSAIARVTARACRPQKLSTVSSLASSKRSIVGDRQIPVFGSVRDQTTLSARASARASRHRPWLNPSAASIADKVAQSKSKTAQWIKSQAVDRRPSQALRQPSTFSVRHSPTSNTSMSVPAPPIVIPKRRTATTGPRQAVRYPSTSNNRPALPPSSLSSLSRPRKTVKPASPDNSIAAIVREAFAFDIDQFRAEVKPLYEKVESNHRYLRRLTRKPVTFDDNPTVIEHPKWIEKEHVHPGPPRILGYLLAWRPVSDSDPYEHTLVWGSDASNIDHSDCVNPDCHRRARDLYMDEYEEWTAPTFSTISE